MPLLNYTTKISPFKTIGEIQGILVKHGARKVLQEYSEDGRIEALSFQIDTLLGLCSVRLPAKPEKVHAVLLKQKVKCDEEQAERVAWRIVKDWVEAQMAILESEMVELDEIFLPYMVSPSGHTLYEAYRDRSLLLPE